MIYKCAGRKRKGGDGTPFCVYESETSWRGRRCPGCGGWFDVHEFGTSAHAAEKELPTAASALSDKADVERMPTGIENFDEVIGGGLVWGQTILFGAPAGTGKTRLGLQLCQTLVERYDEGDVLYASLEETTDDIIKTCKQVGATSTRIKIYGLSSTDEEPDIDTVLAMCERYKPFFLVVDSLQAADGWSIQNTETAAAIKGYCDSKKMCAIVMNHCSNDLQLKGGSTVKHMFKTLVMFYEYDPRQDGRLKDIFGKRFASQVRDGEISMAAMRTLMTGKNRYGAQQKAFFIFNSDGRLVGLEKKKPANGAGGFLELLKGGKKDDEDGDEDESPSAP